MKKTMITVVIWSLILSSVSMVYFFDNIERKELEPVVEAMVSDNNVILNKMIAHIGLAEEALAEFGPNSGTKAAELWAKGVMNRNGVLQYAVMDSKLQEEFRNYLLKDENISWVTGTSSPWVTSYEISAPKDVSSKVKIFDVKFNLATSNGPEKSMKNTITVMDHEGKWLISSIR